MGKHTPGPWFVEPGFAVGSERANICQTYDGGTLTGEQDANARLIAAAPDLLAALQAMVEYLDAGTPVHPGALIHGDARLALAKATGGKA